MRPQDAAAKPGPMPVEVNATGRRPSDLPPGAEAMEAAARVVEGVGKPLAAATRPGGRRSGRRDPGSGPGRGSRSNPVGGRAPPGRTRAPAASDPLREAAAWAQETLMALGRLVLGASVTYGRGGG